jgi:hypothetical protein
MEQKNAYPKMKNEFNLLNNLKMKSIQKMSLVVLSVLTVASCSKDNGDPLNELPVGVALKADAKVKVGDLPVAILEFVAREFPDLTIDEAEEEDNGNFEVELSDGTELIFDADGTFLGVDDDSEENGDYDDSDIAVADLLPAILEYIELNYPGIGIDEAELEHNEQYEVTLNDDTVLIFNTNGEFLGVGVDENDQDGDGDYDWEEEDGHDDGETIDPSQLPELALAYLAETYPDLTIVRAEIEDEGDYEVTLSNGLEVYFDSEGNFLYVDED